jgi:hypothetical protein
MFLARPLGKKIYDDQKSKFSMQMGSNSALACLGLTSLPLIPALLLGRAITMFE